MDIADILSDPHFRDREIVVEAEDPALGTVLMHDIVPRLSATPGVWRRPAPALGAHTAEVLAEAGIDLPEDAR
jgi:crotonobetainyl-CoA:carnitine CoA-transferase CaiB-like acyl-CoA transferase